MIKPKPFSLGLHYDGDVLHVNYCDGSDIERIAADNMPDLKAAVADALEHAADKEDE